MDIQFLHIGSLYGVGVVQLVSPSFKSHKIEWLNLYMDLVNALYTELIIFYLLHNQLTTFFSMKFFNEMNQPLIMYFNRKTEDYQRPVNRLTRFLTNFS